MRPYTPLMASVRTSRKLAQLDDASERLFTRLLTQCDDWGRHDRDALVVNANCWPRLKRSDEETERCLLALERVGLIAVWQSGDYCWLSIPDWDEKAGKIGRRDHRRKSAWPDIGKCRTVPDGSGRKRTEADIASREEETDTDRDPEKNQNQRESNQPPTPFGAGGVGLEDEAKAKRKAEQDEHRKQGKAVWQAAWNEHRAAEEYEFADKHGTALRKLYAKHGAEKLRRRCDALLTDLDQWVFKNASPTLLVSRWSSLGQAAPRRTTQAELNLQATATAAGRIQELERRGQAGVA